MQLLHSIVGNTSKIRDLSKMESIAGTATLTKNMGVKFGEKILIVTDTLKKVREAAIFFETAKKYTDSVSLVELSAASENAQEPPKKVVDMMNEADVALLVTTYSLTHTNAVSTSQKHGTRVASMPGITHEVILRTLTIDYDEVAALSKTIASILTKGSKAFLKSANGTDMIFDLKGRSGYADTGWYHTSGDSGNLPAGEAYIAPKQDETEGLLVFDGIFGHGVVDQPIMVRIEKGHAVDIKGGEGARLLNLTLSRIGKNGYNIAELGVGTNKKARLDSILLEVEKVFETVHVAIGNNAYIGGEVDVPFHSDGVLVKPTLKVDTTYILKNGKFQL